MKKILIVLLAVLMGNLLAVVRENCVQCEGKSCLCTEDGNKTIKCTCGSGAVGSTYFKP